MGFLEDSIKSALAQDDKRAKVEGEISLSKTQLENISKRSF